MSSPTVPTIPSGVPVNAFAQLWMEAMSAVMSQVASASFPMQAGAAEAMPAAVSEDVQLTVTAAGTARGEMNLRLPPGTAVDLAKIFVSDTDTARSELTADDRSALEELFRQIAGHVATSARPKGLEIQLHRKPRGSSKLAAGGKRMDCQRRNRAASGAS